jgi:hypothetical protein
LLSTVSAWGAWDWSAGIYICTIVYLGSESWDYSHHQGQGAMLAGCSKPLRAAHLELLLVKPENVGLLHTRS